ncbi:MAG: ankyrin repeat domain-containing protein, partial [Planctomycetota bacterium]
MAAATGNIEAIKQHSAAGTDLNAKEPAAGSTPLMLAALFDQADAAKLLLDKGANINVRNNEGSTALHTAAFFCRTETVKLLLGKGADVNAQNNRDETALDTVAAPWSQELEGVYSYLGGIIEIQLDLERTKATRPKIAALLREHSERVASAPSIDIWTAAATGNLEAIKQHVAAGTDLNAGEPAAGSTPLIVATLLGQTEAAGLLIENGAKVNARNNEGTTALLTAAFFCHTETVKLLLDKGADVNAKNNTGQTVLDTVAGAWSQDLEGVYKYIAGLLQIQLDIERIKADRPKIAALLRERTSKTGDDIWSAAKSGDNKAIQRYVATGADLNIRGENGNTPLMVTAIFGQTQAAWLLIEKGADVNLREDGGGTALHIAAFFGNTETVKLLLDKGADVNARNLMLQKPLDTVAAPWSPELAEIYKFIAGLLQIELDLEKIKAARPKIAAILREHTGKTGGDIWTAAKDGNIEAVMKHISAGKDINIRSESGATLLIAASASGQTEIAKLLIEKGADVNLREDVGGSTALLAAAFLGHTEIVEMLIDKGADVNARNLSSETPLDTVSAPWSPELAEIYKFIAGLLQIELDLKKIEFERPKIAALLSKHGGKTTGQSTATAATTFRGSYYVNGEIHVNTYGTLEGKPLTTGHSDFKPSWSKTDDMLVFFRRLKNHPVTVMWKTAICIINVDGTGFHQLTDGTHTDFNQTWTRDGSNTPIWNRKNPETGSFYVMQSKVGNSPGQEVALTNKRFHTWAYTCLKNGRILVQSAHPKQGRGYFLMTPNVGGRPRFERIDCELAKKG